MTTRVIINCAMSADGKIALRTRKQTKISNEADRKRVHQLRNKCDAILVGIETVLTDDPKLTVNSKYVKKPRQPVRIVLDSKGRTPKDAFVLDGAARTIIVTNESCKRVFANAETIRCGKRKTDLRKLMELLEGRGIRSVLIEGGSEVIWSFLESRIADEVRIFVGSIVIGGERAPTPAGGEGAANERSVVALRLKSLRALGNGILIRYEVVK
ncbi:MAG: 2,5-diamino-6-(ribosylamino)-4(3H)-pyrimidinone 5'-phosphate reductase [Candidatus Thermoplasmatota archaeon]|nr:2,5-diamino-6-(ribosylamino)-4(3H)-pyrimidinone 5'-phosphate reductase [Candidatus Thermoplasmatota archaeon]